MFKKILDCFAHFRFEKSSCGHAAHDLVDAESAKTIP